MKVGGVADALDKLADAQWWFEGFAAARPAAVDEGRGEHNTLCEQVKALRVWVHGLVIGKARRIAFHDHEKILISYTELEEIIDGLRPMTGDDEVDALIMSDRDEGYRRCLKIHDEYNHELLSATNPDAPF